jgi:hypothetical protein
VRSCKGWSEPPCGPGRCKTTRHALFCCYDEWRVTGLDDTNWRLDYNPFFGSTTPLPYPCQHPKHQV